MKKAIALLSATFLIVFYNNTFVYTYSGSPPTGHTGAPGQETCAHSGCHVGTDENDYLSAIIISKSSPTLEAGKVYELAVGFTTAVDDLPPRSGFQMVAFDENNQSIGNFVTDGVSTDVSTSAGIEYVHHKNAKEQDDIPTYKFEWKAPDNIPKSVTFYTAVLVSNANNNKNGDYVHTMSLTFNSEVTSIETPIVASSLSLNAFLQPVTKELFINYTVPHTDFVQFNLFDLKGQLIKNWSQNQHQAGDFKQVLALNNLLQKGLYIIQIKTDSAIASQKFLAF